MVTMMTMTKVKTKLHKNLGHGSELQLPSSAGDDNDKDDNDDNDNDKGEKREEKTLDMAPSYSCPPQQDAQSRHNWTEILS